MVADQLYEIDALKEIAGGNMGTPVAQTRGRLDGAGAALSERRACRITGQHRSTQRHEPRRGERDEALRARLWKLARASALGYRRVWATLRNDGWEVNGKKIQRLWREEGLRVPAKRRKRATPRRLDGAREAGAGRVRFSV